MCCWYLSQSLVAVVAYAEYHLARIEVSAMHQHYVDLSCTSVTADCPVENTIYGYYPSLPLNAFFVAFFSFFAITNAIYGIYFKTYFFAYVMTVGCISEAIGYGGRIMMNKNPFDEIGFRIQISCLIFAPAFVNAAIYITLKHIVMFFGTAKSRLTPRWYTWIFIACDFTSLMLQAVGGGLAGGAGQDAELRAKGTNTMLAGIVFQVATLVIFGYLALEYIVRTRRSWEAVSPVARNYAQKTSFKLFTAGIIIAFITIFTRCVYRIAEIVGGWANPIMRNEVEYVILEGL